MQIINMHEAKTHFSKLIEAVSKGEEIMIAKAGKPAAMLVPIHAKTPARKSGALKGKMQIATDFDTPLPDDVISSFEGR